MKPFIIISINWKRINSVHPFAEQEDPINTVKSF